MCVHLHVLSREYTTFEGLWQKQSGAMTAGQWGKNSKTVFENNVYVYMIVGCVYTDV